jgi:hypothetical protein
VLRSLVSVGRPDCIVSSCHPDKVLLQARELSDVTQEPPSTRRERDSLFHERPRPFGLALCEMEVSLRRQGSHDEPKRAGLFASN